MYVNFTLKWLGYYYTILLFLYKTYVNKYIDDAPCHRFNLSIIYINNILLVRNKVSADALDQWFAKYIFAKCRELIKKQKFMSFKKVLVLPKRLNVLK